MSNSPFQNNVDGPIIKLGQTTIAAFPCENYQVDNSDQPPSYYEVVGRGHEPNYYNRLRRNDPLPGYDEVVGRNDPPPSYNDVIAEDEENRRLLAENSSLMTEVARLIRANDHMDAQIKSLQHSCERAERSHIVHERKVETLTESEKRLKKLSTLLKRKQREYEESRPRKVEAVLHNCEVRSRSQLEEQQTAHRRERNVYELKINNLNKDIKQAQKRENLNGSHYKELMKPLLKKIEVLREATSRVYKQCESPLRQEMKQAFKRSGDFIKSRSERTPSLLDRFKQKCDLNMVKFMLTVAKIKRKLGKFT